MDSGSSSKKIRWLTIDSGFDEKGKKSHLKKTSKTAKKIKRRTKVLNKRLKKFGRLQNYRQYVNIKTAVLRDITSNEDTDDDTDIYSVRKEDSDESLLSPKLKNDVPKKSKNSGNSRGIRSTKTPKKPKKKSNQANELKSSSSKRSSTKNRRKSKEQSASKLDAASHKMVLRSSENKHSMSKISLTTVDKAVPLESENFNNDSDSLSSLEQMCPLADSTHIEDEDNNNEVLGSTEPNESFNVEYLLNSAFRSSAGENASLYVNISEEDTLLVISSDDDAEYGEEAKEKPEQKLDLEKSVKKEFEHEQKQPRIREPSSLNRELAESFQPVIVSTKIVNGKNMIIRECDDAHPTGNPDNDTSSNDDLVFAKAPFFDGTEPLDDEENELSSGSGRVGKYECIELVSDSCDCSESEDRKEGIKEHPADTEEEFDLSASVICIDVSETSNESIVGDTAFLQSSSQVISDLSGFDEAIDNSDKGFYEVDLPSSTNNQRSSSLFTASKSKDGTCTMMKRVDRDSEDRLPERAAIGSANKSIKCQIRGQDKFPLLTVLKKKKIHEPGVVEEIKKEKDKGDLKGKIEKYSMSDDNIDDNRGREQANVDSAMNDGSHKTKSLQCQLKNRACRADEKKDFSATCGGKNDERQRSRGGGSHDRSGQRSDQESSRHVKLRDFTNREGLVANTEISTVTAKDLNKCARENGDEEVWLMEFPKSIVTDGNTLCGKKMSLKKEEMTINGTTYKTSSRDEKSVTCILSSGRNTARYETVNVKSAGTIVVRQETSDRTASWVSQFHTAQTPVRADAAARIVPFPKNLKSRNPLLSLSSTGGFNRLSTTKDSPRLPEVEEASKKKRKLDRGNENQEIPRKSAR